MSDERQWMVAPDETRIEIAIGPEARVSPEVRAALEQLINAIAQQDDVQGYAMCTTRIECQTVKTTLCAVNMICSSVVIG